MLESVLLVVWRRRQQLSIAEVRAQAQASLGGDAALEAFKEFRDQVTHVEVESQKTDMRKTLDAWSKSPALSVTPLAGVGKQPTRTNKTLTEEQSSRYFKPRK